MSWKDDSSNASFEMEEVRRAFEKFGISELLVAADGSISPHIGCLRLFRYLSDNGLMIDLHLAILRARQSNGKTDRDSEVPAG
jgi:hypothetical protein